jgi:hypothetical protein
VKRLALAAAAAAAAGLTACSHSSASISAPATHGTAVGAAIGAPPVGCRQQYQTWEHGPGKGLIATFHAVSVASTAADHQALTTALKKARPVIARATRYPVPACADPRGYWTVLLMHVNAAATGKSSASTEQAAVRGVPEIEQELTAELKATVQ